MITFFDEQDLISFGNYMLSEERKQSILEVPNVSEEIKKEALQAVTPFDYGMWYEIRKQQEENYYEADNDDEELIEEGE